MLLTPEMLKPFEVRFWYSREFFLVFLICLYAGLQLSFILTILPSCVGATKYLKDSTRLVGLIGCLVGIGEIVGSGISAFVSRFKSFERGPIVAVGLISEYIAYIAVFSMLPAKSTMKNTNEKGTDPFFYTENNGSTRNKIWQTELLPGSMSRIYSTK